MTKPKFLDTPHGSRIAYHLTDGAAPGVVFLPGFASNMNGVKARHLQAWAEQSGRGFLRFDYSGHGESGGDFKEGCVGDWARDAAAAISTLTHGPQVLVGSSMGGWIALLLAREGVLPVAGLVGVAAAPDFTRSLWESLDPQRKEALGREGSIDVPSQYSASPYVVSKRLIDDGESQSVLRTPLCLSCPVRLLQGTADVDVSVGTALHLLEHLHAEDIQLVLVKGGDHQLSDAGCLAAVERAIADVS